MAYITFTTKMSVMVKWDRTLDATLDVRGLTHYGLKNVFLFSVCVRDHQNISSVLS